MSVNHMDGLCWRTPLYSCTSMGRAAILSLKALSTVQPILAAEVEEANAIMINVTRLFRKNLFCYLVKNLLIFSRIFK